VVNRTARWVIEIVSWFDIGDCHRLYGSGKERQILLNRCSNSSTHALVPIQVNISNNCGKGFFAYARNEDLPRWKR
jgi:hypothetical protein